MSRLIFNQLNFGWNADPNVVRPVVEVSGRDLLLRFELNQYQFEEFEEGDLGVLRFASCVRYRLGRVNDEGWYRGQCRYSKTAPSWGEFYELFGPDAVADKPTDWVRISPAKGGRHFLFYFRDEEFECFAADWGFEDAPDNALLRIKKG